ncbi:YppE family protein [Macrococcus capreoli]|uniref:YppE family protein n=1 Tax=Macrococcus capreoli TaxID=2982690 RepID=UPI0021D613B3|nr:YppE family protein [Macrococcus sp. TMW 2.2395]MCU7556734.1 YppE family protein [Macrococcus sp. TMW 2.2395]
MLQKCIITLIQDLNAIEIYYTQAKNGRNFNFVIDVQPFTEKIDRHIEDLQQFHPAIIQLPLMNEQKLSLLILHLRELSVDCFFEKTSKKLFIDKFKAVNHDLNYILRQTEQ